MVSNLVRNRDLADRQSDEQFIGVPCVQSYDMRLKVKERATHLSSS